MQGSDAVIEFLNEALTAELTAINQYFAHAKICENWGWKGLASAFREESIEEMRDAEKLIERILLLEGHPNLQRLLLRRYFEYRIAQQPCLEKMLNHWLLRINIHYQ